MPPLKKKVFIIYKDFETKLKKESPSAVKSLENSIEYFLTCFSFPKEEWISLRTTNIIEGWLKNKKKN